MADSAHQALADVAALWSVDRASHEDVVAVAAEALASGLDTPGLTRLAGVFRQEAHYMVPELLPLALKELGLPYHERGSHAGKVAAARVMARRCLDGELVPRELARWMHRTIGHGDVDELEALVVLDDCYDEIEWAAETAADVDDMVFRACRVLIAGDE